MRITAEIGERFCVDAVSSSLMAALGGTPVPLPAAAGAATTKATAGTDHALAVKTDRRVKADDDSEPFLGVTPRR